MVWYGGKDNKMFSYLHNNIILCRYSSDRFAGFTFHFIFRFTVPPFYIITSYISRLTRFVVFDLICFLYRPKPTGLEKPLSRYRRADKVQTGCPRLGDRRRASSAVPSRATMYALYVRVHRSRKTKFLMGRSA